MAEQHQPQQRAAEDLKKLAKASWAKSQQILRKLRAEIDAFEKEEAIHSDFSRYKGLSDTIANYRLGCVQILPVDPEFFCKTVQEPLWSAHSLINNFYRTTLDRLRGNNFAVFKSKLEGLYDKFLKTSFEFYSHYVRTVSQNYNIPGLQQAAGTGPVTPAETAAPLDQRVLVDLQHSCAMAVLHLGDLTRYREKLRAKKNNRRKDQSKDAANASKSSDMSTPNEYYDSAAQWFPTSGFPHHQKGVISLEEKNDFDVVFNFLRAAAIEHPHPLASQNLTSEFKTIRASDSSAPAKSHESIAILQKWFLVLHAHHHTGEPFTRQVAIEKEVTSRLRNALKSESSSQQTLARIVVINMAAQHVASAKIKAKQTERASKTLSHLLRLNAIFFNIILQVFTNELDEIKESRRRWDQTPNRDTDEERPGATGTLQRCLPLVRLYTSWLFACRLELRDACANTIFNDAFAEVCTRVASALTLLAEVYGNAAMRITPYLLEEDCLTQGMLPLSSPEMPPKCLLSYDQNRDRYKMLKQNINDVEGYWNDKTELWARVLDILYCGHELTVDDTLPFAVVEGPGDILMFTYGSPTPVGGDSGQRASTQQEHEDLDFAQRSQHEHRSTHDASGHYSPAMERPRGHGISYDQQFLDGASSDRSHGTTHVPQQLVAERELYEGLYGVENATGHAGGSPMVQHNSQTRSGNSSLGPAQASSWVNQQQLPMQPANLGQESTDYDFTNNTDLMDRLDDFLQPPKTKQAQQGPNRTAKEPSYGMHTATANEAFGAMPDQSSGTLNAKAFPGLPWGMFYSPKDKGRDAPAHLNSPRELDGAFEEMVLVDSAAAPVRNPPKPMTDGSKEKYSIGPCTPAVGSSQQSPSGGEAAHRARLLEAFSQKAPATDLSPRQPQPYVAPEASPQQHSPGAYEVAGDFPGSSGNTAFSNQSSLYQSTPYNHPGQGQGQVQTAANPYAGATAWGRNPAVDGLKDDPTAYRNQTDYGMQDTRRFVENYDETVFRTAMDGQQTSPYAQGSKGRRHNV